jgi:diacylglycerol kinase family enzyme
MKADLRDLRVAAVLNRSSGSCDATAEATLISILQSQGITPTAARSVDGAEIVAALDDMAAANIDVLIVLGGDGTIRTAAEKCSDAGILFIALPGGTMNMLPKAIYGERPWQEALAETIAQPYTATIGGGRVSGYRFFCAGIFGSPAHWAEAREALRANRLREAFDRALRAYRRSFSTKLRYRFGSGGEGTAKALAVICPLISKSMPSDAPTLEAAALNPSDLGGVFSLALSGMFSDWRADANVTTCAARSIQISSRKAIPALLDGEMVRLDRTAEIRFIPDAFHALVPEGSPLLAVRQEEAA